jgi:hypothetical protein
MSTSCEAVNIKTLLTALLFDFLLHKPSNAGSISDVTTEVEIKIAATSKEGPPGTNKLYFLLSFISTNNDVKYDV